MSGSEREWRCHACGTLLGLAAEGKLHLKYKTAQYTVTGVVTATCRRCSAENQMVCTPDAPAGGRAA